MAIVTILDSLKFLHPTPYFHFETLCHIIVMENQCSIMELLVDYLEFLSDIRDFYFIPVQQLTQFYSIFQQVSFYLGLFVLFLFPVLFQGFLGFLEAFIREPIAMFQGGQYLMNGLLRLIFPSYKMLLACLPFLFFYFSNSLPFLSFFPSSILSLSLSCITQLPLCIQL